MLIVFSVFTIDRHLEVTFRAMVLVGREIWVILPKNFRLMFQNCDFGQLSN